jgi:hypothetical protein
MRRGACIQGAKQSSTRPRPGRKREPIHHLRPRPCVLRLPDLVRDVNRGLKRVFICLVTICIGIVGSRGSGGNYFPPEFDRFENFGIIRFQPLSQKVSSSLRDLKG